MKPIERRTAAEQFLAEVATFADSPAGEALIASDPEMTVRLFIERAQKLMKSKKAA